MTPLTSEKYANVFEKVEHIKDEMNSGSSDKAGSDIDSEMDSHSSKEFDSEKKYTYGIGEDLCDKNEEIASKSISDEKSLYPPELVFIKEEPVTDVTACDLLSAECLEAGSESVDFGESNHLQFGCYTLPSTLSSDALATQEMLVTGDIAQGNQFKSGVVTHKCEICDKNYSSTQALKRHLITHTGLKPFSCEICGYRCNRISNLKIHMQIHINDLAYKCDLCEKAFNRSSYLARHKMFHVSVETIENVTVHGDIRSGNLSFECEICHKAFPKIVGIKNHLKVHTREYKPNKCEVCDKVFCDKWTLKTHMICHCTVKPYNCVICERGFNQRSHFERHLRAHAGEKPYKCDVCGMSFSSSSNAKRHIVKIHVRKSFL